MTQSPPPLFWRRLALIAAAAFGLRASAAVLLERHPLFPAYYYQDALLTDQLAKRVFSLWRDGRLPPLPYAPSQRLLAVLTAALYRAAGPRPLAAQLVNGALGGAAVFALGALGLVYAAPQAALWGAGLIAVWPSDVFYSSQNLKEAPIHALAWFALLALLGAPQSRRAAGWGAAGVTAMIAAGLIRPYLLIPFFASLAAASFYSAISRADRKKIAFPLGAALIGALAYHAASDLIYNRLIPAPKYSVATENVIVPVAVDAQGRRFNPLSPRAVGEFRRYRQSSDAANSRFTTGRDIQSQILPGARLDGWGDLALFLPRGAFYALFMPLPGLYPAEGKLGRLMASLENLAALALFLLACVSLARRRLDACRFAIAVFVAVMALASGLFELDLGSAARHKLLYLPLLFPLAAEEALSLMRRRKGRI